VPWPWEEQELDSSGCVQPRGDSEQEAWIILAVFILERLVRDTSEKEEDKDLQ
jgi:hypothetical protein